MNQSADGTRRKKDLMLLSENSVENTIPGDKSGAWDKSKAESPVTKQDQISASEPGQADGTLPNGLGNAAPTLCFRPVK